MFDLWIVKTAYAVEDVTTLVKKINKAVINPLIGLMFVVATAYFLYGVFNFLAAGSAKNDESRNAGKRHMFWGIIGMVIMFSVYGIMRLIASTIGAKL